MKKIRFNLLFRSIQGAIGKKYVIKHYGKKMVITKYPAMENIIASKKQRSQRNLFKEAVAYAKIIVSDPVRKAAWQKKIKRKNGVYNEAIKKYLLMTKNEKEGLLLKANYLINQSFQNISTEEMKKFILSDANFQFFNHQKIKIVLLSKNQIHYEAKKN